jgi:DNA processing protein
VGKVAVHKLIDTFGTFGDCLAASDEALKTCLNAKQRDAIKDPSIFGTALRQAHKISSRAAELGAIIVTRFDDDYPQRLLELNEPPLLLYVAGDMSILEKSVSIVGAREPTDFGGKAGFAIASAFAREGFSIVSSLSRGIDAYVHTACQEANTPSCAVFASGLDQYSSEAAKQAAIRIYNNGGLMISVSPFGEEQNRGNIIERDRVIAALSLGTIFVQGDPYSSALQTVRYAVTLDRPIYVPTIPEKYLREELNHTACDLANMPLSQFSTKSEWAGRASEIAAERPNDTIAQRIMSRDDYPRIFDELTSRLAPSLMHPGRIFVSDIGATF